MALPSSSGRLNAILFLAAEPSFGKKEVVDPKTSICPLEDDGDCTILPLVDASLSSSIVYKLNKNIRTKGTDGHTYSTLSIAHNVITHFSVVGHCSKFCRERITGIIYIECSLFSLLNVLMLDNLSNIERYHPIPYKNGMISNCKLAQIVPTYNTAMWALICPRFLVFTKQKIEMYHGNSKIHKI